MRKSIAGINNPMYGKHHTLIARKKIGEAHKGKPSWNRRTMVDNLRKCTFCKKLLSLKEFQQDKHVSDGLRCRCKKCNYKYNNERALERRIWMEKICEICHKPFLTHRKWDRTCNLKCQKIFIY